MLRTVTTYYLEMHTPAELQPSQSRAADFRAARVALPSPELSRFFYTAVGGRWYWIDRLPWTYAQWQAYLNRPELETWIGYSEDTPAGYVELEQQPEQTVEIAAFGLLPQFIGRGIGGALLTSAIQRAWQFDARRVWVHTCSLDGPAALQNYQARGFKLYHHENAEVELPDSPPGPWPGA